jgi:hypothetical protein
MFYVQLTKPLAGVRNTMFVFHTIEEASEFASCIHAQHPDAETVTDYVGEPTEVFENWSF